MSSYLACFSIDRKPRSGGFSVHEYLLKNSAILDLGTSLHVFNEISRFNNFKATSEEFLYAGEQQVQIQGYGNVDIKVKGPNKSYSLITLRGVAFCENFACNIISYRKLRQQGLYWDSRPGHDYLR